ncbi:MAG: nitrogenase cofactor biosynthesis protein NifB [Rhodospirillales bacterium]
MSSLDDTATVAEVGIAKEAPVGRTVISLDAVLNSKSPGISSASAKRAGCASSQGCGTAPKDGDLPPEILARVHDHPCYNEDAHHYFARMHVAVAPACNIQCHYCNRKYDCANESRPGVVSERLSPDDGVRKVLAVAARMPELSVVGIAGPGDALADYRNTFATFRRLRQEMPDLKLCLSTNGLALPDHVEAIKDLGIDHVTITINAIDPEIGARIYAWVFFDHRRLTGLEAATVLRDRQLAGLDALVAAGVLVKVNSVLIPGVNDHHLEEVNAEVRRRGAFLHNIMPLISDPRHGTHYGLTGQRGPTAAELQAVQERLGGDARLMRHCRQCRADAVGLLGEDRGGEFALAALPEIDAAATLAAEEERRAYRAVIAREREDKGDEADEAGDSVRRLGMARTVLIAVCSKGGGRINQHFGHASEFKVFAADADGIRFVGHRCIERYCRGGDGDDDVLEATIAALDGISAVFCAKIGRCPADALAAAGITVSEAYAFEYIETAIARHLEASTAGAEARTVGRRA